MFEDESVRVAEASVRRASIISRDMGYGRESDRVMAGSRGSSASAVTEKFGSKEWRMKGRLRSI